MNQPRVTVRAGRESDARLFREIRCESLRESPHAYGARYEDVVTKPLKYWKTLLRQRRYFFACDELQILGMACVDHYERGGASRLGVFSMYVRAEHRGSDIATVLMNTCKSHARESGQTALFLDVVAGNERATAFYVREGFVPAGGTQAMLSDTSRMMVPMVCDL